MPNLVGQTLAGRYRVEEELGRGGMAEVYKVWDEERAVYLALKLLRDDLSQDPVFLRRFRREGRTLEQFRHPHIVGFYGLEQDDMLAFMLMDFVDGVPLRAEIFRSRPKGMSLQRMLEVLGPVCSALHYAHGRGMVHCDIKPANVMIDKNGRVLVTDFGIARMTDAATATMVGFGTPAYMAPELVRGKDPMPQSDVYSLGVMLFEMLTGGERPFTGERAEITGSTSDKVRWEQVNLEPPSPREWNEEVTPEVEAVVRKCLSKQPEERYGSVLELLNALTTAAGEQAPALVMEQPERKVAKVAAVRARPARLARRARPAEAVAPKPLRRKPKPWVWLIGVGGVVIAILVVAGLSLSGGGRRLTPGASVPATATAIDIPTEDSSPEAFEDPGPALGSVEDPITWVFLTNGPIEDITSAADGLTGLLHGETGLYFEPLLVEDYVDVVDAMCGLPNSAHMATMSIFPYLHASAMGCAEAALVSERYGSLTYAGQLIVRADAGIQDLHDLEGRSFCRPEQFSLSGWIIPWLELVAAGVDVNSISIIDAGGHDEVVRFVYRGDCDAGSAYVDVRASLDDELPDVMEVIEVIAYTTDIPNDGVQYHPTIPYALRDQINAALLTIAETELGAEIFDELFWWQILLEVDQGIYTPVQNLLDAAGLSPEELY
jgi:phosphate/phosphite/phosphonate ABC transporter binding protein